MPRQISLEWGNSPQYFGTKDYIRNREAGISNKRITDYLDKNPHVLRKHNVAGNTAGIYERAAGRGQISTRFGKDGHFFGHQDYSGNRRMGWSSGEIKSWLDRNTGRLRKRNTPGGGGIYDQMSRDDDGWFNKLPEPRSPDVLQSGAGGMGNPTDASGVRPNKSVASTEGLAGAGTGPNFGRSGLKIKNLNLVN